MHITKNFFVALSMLLVCPLLLTAQQQDQVDQITHVSLPSCNIKMDIPDVFIYDDSQTAYIYTGAAASISAEELLGTQFSFLKKIMTKSTLEQQQMKVLETSALRTKSGLEAILYTISLSVVSQDGKTTTEFERLIFICGNDQKSALVNIQYPMVTKKLLGDVLRACLLSIEL